MRGAVEFDIECQWKKDRLECTFFRQVVEKSRWFESGGCTVEVKLGVNRIAIGLV